MGLAESISNRSDVCIRFHSGADGAGKPFKRLGGVVVGRRLIQVLNCESAIVNHRSGTETDWAQVPNEDDGSGFH
jgi:hypothetical protein